jgi:hypothetical protein
MGALAAPVIMGGATILGGGLSYFGQKGANRANRRSADRMADVELQRHKESLGFEKQKWSEYLRDLKQIRAAIPSERAERRRLTQRKFEAALEGYQLKKQALADATKSFKGLISEQKQLKLDPTRSPVWKSFRDAISKAASKQIKSLSGQMARAGRTGGAQDRMRRDVSETLMSNLGSEMLKIQGQAQQKQLDLEGRKSMLELSMTPEMPFQEYLGDPRLGVSPSQYSGVLQQGRLVEPAQEIFQPIDMTGFGQAAAMLFDQNKQMGTHGTSNLRFDQPDYWTEYLR